MSLGKQVLDFLYRESACEYPRTTRTIHCCMHRTELIVRYCSDAPYVHDNRTCVTRYPAGSLLRTLLNHQLYSIGDDEY